MATLTLCSCGTQHPRNERCPKCNHGKRKGHYKTTKERGYGHDWRKLSEAIAKEDPLCPDCLAEEKVNPGDGRHHIRKIADAPHLRLERSNIMNLCDRHHAIREREGR